MSIVNTVYRVLCRHKKLFIQESNEHQIIRNLIRVFQISLKETLKSVRVVSLFFFQFTQAYTKSGSF